MKILLDIHDKTICDQMETALAAAGLAVVRKLNRKMECYLTRIPETLNQAQRDRLLLRDHYGLHCQCDTSKFGGHCMCPPSVVDARRRLHALRAQGL